MTNNCEIRRDSGLKRVPESLWHKNSPGHCRASPNTFRVIRFLGGSPKRIWLSIGHSSRRSLLCRLCSTEVCAHCKQRLRGKRTQLEHRRTQFGLLAHFSPNKDSLRQIRRHLEGIYELCASQIIVYQIEISELCGCQIRATQGSLFRVHLKHCKNTQCIKGRSGSAGCSAGREQEQVRARRREGRQIKHVEQQILFSLPNTKKRRLRNPLKGDDKKRRRDKQCQSLSIRTQSESNDAVSYDCIRSRLLAGYLAAFTLMRLFSSLSLLALPRLL